MRTQKKNCVSSNKFVEPLREENGKTRKGHEIKICIKLWSVLCGNEAYVSYENVISRTEAVEVRLG
jgi:hypothetical protein